MAVTRRLLPVFAGIAVAGAVLWYVIAPPRGEDGYRERVADTSATVRSQVQTARIWVETHEDGESTGAAALVGLEEADHDANSALSELESHEAPPGALALRSEFLHVAGDASEALSEIRVAAQLGQWSRVAEIAEELPALAEDLDRLEERARP